MYFLSIFLETGDALKACWVRGAITAMSKSPVRLLDVAVISSAPTRWKWSVCEGPIEIACGYETSRETAQIAGDQALFELLSIGRR
jgi:hypothetical protein